MSSAGEWRFLTNFDFCNLTTKMKWTFVSSQKAFCSKKVTFCENGRFLFVGTSVSHFGGEVEKSSFFRTNSAQGVGHKTLRMQKTCPESLIYFGRLVFFFLEFSFFFWICVFVDFFFLYFF